MWSLMLCGPSLLAAVMAVTASALEDRAFQAKEAIHPKRAVCLFGGSTGYQQTQLNKASCSVLYLDRVEVPAGKTLDLTGLAPGTTVIFQRNTTFGYAEWAGPLVSISGEDITVMGDTDSTLDGSGALYWDGQGGNGGKKKPKFFAAHKLINSRIEGLTIANTPVHVFSISGSRNLTISGVTIDNRAGDALGAANTDGFDVGNSDGVYIDGATVWNQDDCVAVNSGTNIFFTNGFCSGGHGLSIGSVGNRSNNTVANVTFADSRVEASQQAVRVKTISGATGSVSGVTYRNVTFTGATKYGIVVDQAYNGKKGEPTSGVPITGLVLQDVVGDVEGKGVNVYIDCGEASCTDWVWENVQVQGGTKKVECLNVPEGVQC